MTESVLICPECKSKNVALILWGYLGYYDETMQQQVEKKEIVIGGCLVTDHDPKWECNVCNHRWGEREE